MRSTLAPLPGWTARVGRRLVPWVALILLAPTSARADRCEEMTQGWLDRCHQRSRLPMRVVGCPPGRVILHVGRDPETALEVEIARSTRSAFREIGGYGLSPIGEFTNWSNEPEARREALDQVAACIENDPTLAAGGTATMDDGSERDVRSAGKGTPIPWLMLGALFVLLASMVRRLVVHRGIAVHDARARWIWDAWRGVGLGGLGAMLAGTLAVFMIRWVVVPVRFFHQNGQGPMWIEIAMQDVGASRYGPGYAELFGWVATRADPPDVAVCFVMAAASSLIPWFGWRIARGAGAPLCAAWAVAGWLAVHPLLLRLAHSESYFAVHLMLLLAAAAVLARTAHRTRDPSFALSLVAAGLLLAQVVRVHPTSWVPAATIPLVLLFRTTSLRRRIVQTALAGLVIGAIVSATSGVVVLDVLSGSLGEQWQPSRVVRFPDVPVIGWALMVAGLGLVLAARNRISAAVILAATGAVVAMAAATDLLGSTHSWIADAARLQFAPVLLPACIALFREAVKRWPRRAAIAVTVGVSSVAALGIALRYQGNTVIPTDAVEQSWAMEWRSTLPVGSHIDYLARAGDRVFSLPIYESSAIRASGREAAHLARLPVSTASQTYYYRSSLCSTPQGASSCKEFERENVLQPVETRTLPSQSSLPWLPLPFAPIEVGLYRIQRLE